MSLTKRFLNVARAELSSALRGSGGESKGLDSLEAELEAERRAQAQQNDETAQSAAGPREPEDVRAAYGNLELPIGASAAEVRAAYRRLMRRYHPDHHLDDGEREAAATELAHELKAAHDRLLLHLGASAQSE